MGTCVRMGVCMDAYASVYLCVYYVYMLVCAYVCMCVMGV